MKTKTKEIEEKYLISQIYKTGEKKLPHYNTRGRKPIGFNIYDKEGWLIAFIWNTVNAYMPILKINGYICDPLAKLQKK